MLSKFWLRMMQTWANWRQIIASLLFMLLLWYEFDCFCHFSRSKFKFINSILFVRMVIWKLSSFLSKKESKLTLCPPMAEVLFITLVKYEYFFSFFLSFFLKWNFWFIVCLEWKDSCCWVFDGKRCHRWSNRQKQSNSSQLCLYSMSFMSFCIVDFLIII